jgi:hypothetical protein
VRTDWDRDQIIMIQPPLLSGTVSHDISWWHVWIVDTLLDSCHRLLILKHSYNSDMPMSYIVWNSTRDKWEVVLNLVDNSPLCNKMCTYLIWCLFVELGHGSCWHGMDHPTRASWHIVSRFQGTVGMSCYAAWHNEKFFTRPKHGLWHDGTSLCRAGPSISLMIWDYIWPYENMILLWNEWSLSQFHTCNVDFAIYFYDSSYINKIYNAWNEWYYDAITHRFANGISVPYRPKHDPKICVVPCHPSCKDPRHDTNLAFVSCYGSC